MNILIDAVTTYPKQDGLTNRINNVIKILSKKGHKIFVSTSTCNCTYENIEEVLYYTPLVLNGLEYMNINNSNYLEYDSFRLFKFCKKNRINIIHTFQAYIQPTLFVSYYLDIPCVLSYHTNLCEYMKDYSFLNNYIFIKLVKNFEKTFYLYEDIFVPSNSIKDMLQQHININIKLLRPAINKEIFYKCNVEKKYDLVYCGRIAKEKNLDFLLGLSKKYSILLIGNGPYYKQYKSKITNKHNIHMIGELKHSELAKYYQLGKIFITPSKTETLGFTTLEALSCGIPAICMNSYGSKDIFKWGSHLGYTFGFLIDNHSDAVTSIDKILNNTTLYESFCNDGLKFTEKLTWDMSVTDLESKYTTVIDNYKKKNILKKIGIILLYIIVSILTKILKVIITIVN
tara:strand:- start:94 stop:1293 length:1200 start_codon:yes stop_codon:yes gene_type:complete